MNSAADDGTTQAAGLAGKMCCCVRPASGHGALTLLLALGLVGWLQ